MNIDIADHLSSDEMKRIVSDAFAAHCAEIFRTDHERIFSNAAHIIVRQMVDEAFDGDAAAAVAEKTKGVISGLTSFTVFGSRGVYDREDTEGRKAITVAVKKHRERIENRVAKIVDSISREEVLEAIAESKMSFTLARTA